MTTHTADAPFRTSTVRAAGKMAHPELSTAAAIVGCILVAIAIGLILIALTSVGQAATAHHQIGHAAVVGASATVSADSAKEATKVAAAHGPTVRPWRESLRGRAMGAGRAPASALLRPSLTQQ